MVITKKLFEEFGPIKFLEKVPKQFVSSLLLEDFDDVIKAAFQDENHQHLENLVAANFLSSESF